MTVAIALFTADLRMHDNPVLRGALDAADQVVPLFVLDDGVRAAGFVTPNRAAFLAGCLADLDAVAARVRRAARRALRRRRRARSAAWPRRPAPGRCTSRATSARTPSAARNACARRCPRARAARPRGRARRGPAGRGHARRKAPLRGLHALLPAVDARSADAVRWRRRRDLGAVRPVRAAARGGRARPRTALAGPSRGRGERGAAPRHGVAGRADRPVRRDARRPGRRRHLAAVAVPALRLPVPGRAGAPGRAAWRGGRGGVRPAGRLARLPPADARRPSRGRRTTTTAPTATAGAHDDADVGGLARRASPAIRWSTPRCASSRPRAGCTTAAG